MTEKKESGLGRTKLIIGIIGGIITAVVFATGAKSLPEILEIFRDDDPDLEYYLEFGAMHFGINDYESAIVNYTQAIILDSSCATAYYGRGRAYSRLNEYDQAIANYDKAIELDPDYARTHNPDYAKAYYNRGLTYHNQGNYGQAITNYSKAIELDPYYAEAYQGRGSALYDRGDFGGGDDYDKAIELNPNSALAFTVRGNVHLQQDNYKQAITNYSKAIELDPDFATAYHGRGLAYTYQADYERATADFQRYLELDPTTSNRKQVEGWISELEAQLNP